jgi:uroporphyrinogen decarboxylase
VITESTIAFIHAARATGIAGVFLALQHASYDLLNEGEYCEFGRPYDLRVLEAAAGLWLNVLHIHGKNVMFDLVADYPVQAVNWHDRETSPSLRDAMKHFPRALIGGIGQMETLVRGSPEQIRAEVHDALEQTGGKRLVVGTGCVTWITTPAGNIRAARLAVEE